MRFNQREEAARATAVLDQQARGDVQAGERSRCRCRRRCAARNSLLEQLAVNYYFQAED